MLMFYNIQTTNLIFVDKKMRYAINSYNIAWFQIVSDIKYDTVFFPSFKVRCEIFGPGPNQCYVGLQGFTKNGLT